MKLSADKAGTVLILAGLIFSLFHLQTRLKAENDNRRVEILISPEEGQLSESAVIQEYSFKELNFMAIATRWSPGLSHPFKKINSGSTVLIFQDRDFYKEAFATAKIKFNDKVEKKEKKGLYYIYFKDLSWDKVAPVGAGIVYPKKNFKRLYIRPLNDRKVNRESIDRIFDRSPASGMIFKGEEVLGFPDKLDYVNKRIKKKNMLILNIEFFPQRGMKKLSSGLRASLLHSLPDFLEPDQSLLRAKRAMRERSARVFYFKEKGAALKFKKLLQKYILVLGEPGGIIIGSDFSFMPIFSAFFIITGLMLLAGVSSRALLYLVIIFSTFLAAGEGGRHFLIPVTAAIIPPYP